MIDGRWKTTTMSVSIVGQDVAHCYQGRRFEFKETKILFKLLFQLRIIIESDLTNQHTV